MMEQKIAAFVWHQSFVRWKGKDSHADCMGFRGWSSEWLFFRRC